MPPTPSWTHRVSAAKGPFFLCDRRVVEDYWMVERFVRRPHRHPKNPLLVRNRPWEGTGPYLGGTVLFDPELGKFMMWYSVWNKEAYEKNMPFSYNVCYAESRDGISWTKPELGVFKYDGDTRNNCIRLGTDKTQGIDVCINPRPDRYPGRFLAIHNQKGGVFVSYSDDGKAFTRLCSRPAIPYHSDTHNNFVYDEVRDRWLMYCRPRAWAGYHRRRVAVQLSKDLCSWTHERTILVPTETEIPEYYGMTVFRRGDMFFGIVKIYDMKTGSMHGELAWSGDGISWEMHPKHPSFISLGRKGSWDGGMVTAAESPVIIGKKMLFYYGGFPLDHNQMTEENVGSIGLMEGELDRMVGMRPNAEDEGTILTRPLLKQTGDLFINCTVEQDRGGAVLAELRTDDNRPISGFTLADCDGVSHSGFEEKVTWRGRSLSEASADEFRIFFQLTDAAIYTFDIRRQDPGEL